MVKPCSPIWLQEPFRAELLTAYIQGSVQVSQSLQLLEISKFVFYEMRISGVLSAHISADVWGSHLSGMYLEFCPVPKL